MIDAGEVDFALVHAPEKKNSSLTFKKLFDAAFMLVTPLGHPLLEGKPALESIARWPLILLSEQSYTRRYLERAMKDAGLEYHVALEMDHTEMIRRYVEIGMGIALTVTQEFALSRGYESNLGAIDLSHLFSPVEIGIATLHGKFLSRGALDFIETLIAFSGQSPAAKEPT